MKNNTHSLMPVIAEAERLIVAAIDHFGLTVKATDIVVTVQSKGRMNAVGWFGPDRWDHDHHEINLSAEHLRTDDMGELLLHELAHAENNALGVKDCSGNQVHNGRFKDMAERLGLVFEDGRNKQYGWAFTSLGAGGREFLKEIEFDKKVFTLSRIGAEESEKKKGPGSRMHKCECPDCGYIVRTSRKWIEVGVPTCPCGTVMVYEEPEEAEDAA